MSDFVDRYEMELRLAAARHYSARGWRARLSDALRRRPWHTTGLVIAALATPAYAATQGWSPSLGGSERTRPTQTAGGVPLEQVELLGVLRRAQTSGDRAPETVKALSLLTKGVRGVRVGAVRALGGDPPVTLIPVTEYVRPASDDVTERPLEDALCLFAPDRAGAQDDGGGFLCFTTADVQNGRAVLALGRHVAVLVPDDVRRVDVRYATDRPAQPVTVDGNLAQFDAPEDRPASARDFEQTWRDADGASIRTIAPQDGAPLRTTDEARPAGRVICSPLLSKSACDALKNPNVEKP